MDINLLKIDSIRSVWEEKQQQWLYVVKDVVGFLANSVNSADYIKKLRMRDSFLSSHWDTFVQLVPIQTASGVQNLSCTSLEGVFRLAMSISSYKSEMLKRWLCSLSINAVRGYSNPLIPFNEWFKIIDKNNDNPKTVTKILTGKMTNEELASTISIDVNDAENKLISSIVQSSLEKPSAVDKHISIETFLTMADLPLKPYILPIAKKAKVKEVSKKAVQRRGRKPKELLENEVKSTIVSSKESKEKSKKKKSKKKKK